MAILTVKAVVLAVTNGRSKAAHNALCVILTLLIAKLVTNPLEMPIQNTSCTSQHHPLIRSNQGYIILIA